MSPKSSREACAREGYRCCAGFQPLTYGTKKTGAGRLASQECACVCHREFQEVMRIAERSDTISREGTRHEGAADVV